MEYALVRSPEWVPDYRNNHGAGTSVSRAPRALDGEPLWSASGDFGPHSPGIGLSEVKEPIPYGYSLSSAALFFCRTLQPLAAAELAALNKPFEDKRAELKTAQEREHAEHRARSAERQSRQIAALRHFFEP